MSSNNIEIEAKVLLSKSDYDKLVRQMHFPENSTVQTNYYLDSRDRILKKYDMALRLREENGTYAFTLKAPLSEGLLQKDQSLSEKEAKVLIDNGLFPRGEIADFLDMLQIDPSKLCVLAKLTTSRKVLPYKGTNLDISKNSYGTVVDYELECDSDSFTQSQNTLRNICTQYNVPYELNSVNKETRAINAALVK